MKLKTDVRSNFNDQELYARKGEEVKVISDHDNVMIVEAVDGFRFSVKKIDLTEEDIPRETVAEVPVQKPISKPAAKKTKAKQQQNTLF